MGVERQRQKRAIEWEKEKREKTIRPIERNMRTDTGIVRQTAEMKRKMLQWWNEKEQQQEQQNWWR